VCVRACVHARTLVLSSEILSALTVYNICCVHICCILDDSTLKEDAVPELSE
jgi:hypothetical protein